MSEQPLGQHYASLLRHAELFGVEGVYELAATPSASPQALALLRLELDAIEAKRKNGRYTVGTRRRRRPEETLDLVRQLRHEQRWTIQAVADKLGVSDAYVRKCLAKSRSAENGATNQHG